MEGRNNLFWTNSFAIDGYGNIKLFLCLLCEALTFEVMEKHNCELLLNHTRYYEIEFVL